jgi:hypothetical protein
MEIALLWQVSVSQVSRRQFQSFRKILWNFKLSKRRIPCSHQDALLCREDSDSSACICPDIRATPFGRSSVFKKNLDFLCRCGLGRQLATIRMLGQYRPNATLIWKRVKRFMKRRLHSSPSGRCLDKSESVAI